jgi:hypothetical protein
MKKKVISYVLWGKSKLYNQGAIINVHDAKRFYPGWTVRIHCAEDAPALEELKLLDCEVVTFKPAVSADGLYAWNNIFWRASPAADSDVDIAIFRDADSRLSVREVAAVDEWLKTDKALHVMHDYPGHYLMPICGGMWGIRGGWLPHLKEMIERWCEAKNMIEITDKLSCVDEPFLGDVIWPMFKYGNYIGHGSPHNQPEMVPWGNNEYPFPEHSPMEHGYFVGQKIATEPSQKISKFLLRRK